MVQPRQQTLSSVRRDAWVEVDLSAIEKNLTTVSGFLAGGKSPQTRKTKLMAVVKGDGYGHGSVAIAEMLVTIGADWLGVASVDEACQLRSADIKAPILILGPAPAWAVKTAIESDLDMTVTSLGELKDINQTALRAKKIANVNIKVDTGMHRLGVLPKNLVPMLEFVKKSPQLKLVSVFSHLAMAGDQEATSRQNAIFKQSVETARHIITTPFLAHLASSEAARYFPETHYDMVRAGIYLYGLEAKKESEILIPSMSVRARINHTQEIEEGESAGYNYTWTAKRRSRLASIPIGYADGVNRRLSNRMKCILMGKEIPQAGIISMDQMLIDITDVPEAQEGDVITLIGQEQGDESPLQQHAPKLSLAQWASMLDTITYELACNLRVRLPRIYTRPRTSHFPQQSK